ncbi:AAA family ATPase [Yinghuangia soli]|uniref:ATP-binding protein n=1 Tax=Yinghuangia soli TaxID=2908204 RepID=A0AA41PZN2_9ACTN|nr:ATP-binding protein [Yinghuangia soli]MCF2528066.1 ATP-binding protein [Yinghuangia soli]
MTAFIGRVWQLAQLDRQLSAVRRRIGPGERPGRAILVRGRRQVGKSRLAEEFVERAGVPAVFFTASTGCTAEQLELFARTAAASNLHAAYLFDDLRPDSWESALELFATAAVGDAPCILVLDGLPELVAADPALEATLQKVFDRVLSRLPVLVIGSGSGASPTSARRPAALRTQLWGVGSAR